MKNEFPLQEKLVRRVLCNFYITSFAILEFRSFNANKLFTKVDTVRLNSGRNSHRNSLTFRITNGHRKSVTLSFLFAVQYV